MNSENSSEMFEHYDFTASSGQAPLRVDKFLMNFIENASRNKIQKAASNGNILVNNVSVKSSHKVKAGDKVSVVYSYPKQNNEIVPQDIHIDIEYEDKDILIVNKKAGMVVHPGFGNYDGTLVNALAYHFDNLPNKSNENRPGLVHRIDKNTSGVLVIAKNEESMIKLSKKFEERDLNRLYIALIWGEPKESVGTITGNIGRSLKNRKIMSVFPDGEYGKHAVTNYKVIESFGYVSMVECKLETGRTHQIRAHFKYLGHPLFNDAEYGGDAILKGTTFTKYKQFVQNCFKICPRQALHAKSLEFEHPTSKKNVSFVSDLPDDMKKLVDKWRNYSKNQKL